MEHMSKNDFQKKDFKNKIPLLQLNTYKEKGRGEALVHCNEIWTHTDGLIKEFLGLSLPHFPLQVLEKAKSMARTVV